MLHGTETNGNLDCSYYETCTHKKFSGILGLEQFTGSTGSDTSQVSICSKGDYLKLSLNHVTCETIKYYHIIYFYLCTVAVQTLCMSNSKYMLHNLARPQEFISTHSFVDRYIKLWYSLLQLRSLKRLF